MHTEVDMAAPDRPVHVDTFKVILIPMFEVSRMVKKKDRFIRKKTARGMYSWWHYISRQRLLTKAELVPGCTVADCDTSKTCGACESIHKNMGGRKVRRKSTRHKKCVFIALSMVEHKLLIDHVLYFP